MDRAATDRANKCMAGDEMLCVYGRRITGSGTRSGLCSRRMLSWMLCCLLHASFAVRMENA